jgi:predicted AAA+ superfamily ATPase
MEILLEELYKTDLQLEKFHPRKISLDENSYQISGITQSGKTKLIKSYLLSRKKSSYLYINCEDVRINKKHFNSKIAEFCKKNKIETLVYDNYQEGFVFINIPQLIIASQEYYNYPFLKHIKLYPLDYEEFLAYEHKYDSTALNHFVQLGGFAHMHKLSSDERINYLQKTLRCKLDAIEFDILLLVAKFNSQKLSAFTLYERLKQSRKISKDKLYKSFDSLEKRSYIHLLAKYAHARATKKVYLCDIALKQALSTEKNFARLFENMVYLELLKANKELFYDEGIDFYLPNEHTVIICKPFLDERRLFKRLESIEAFLVTHSIERIEVITMNKESSLSHPLAQVAIIPFDIWALGD